MNKQRKVVITTTYNEMGIIIDTKAEEVAQPNLQPTCNQLTTDTISRQAAIDAAALSAAEWDGMYVQDINGSIRKALEDLPSIQPERKTGYWIPVTHSRGGHECNRCHDYAPSYQNGDEYLANYCPHCGAYMKGATFT